MTSTSLLTTWREKSSWFCWKSMHRPKIKKYRALELPSLTLTSANICKLLQPKYMDKLLILSILGLRATTKTQGSLKSYFSLDLVNGNASDRCSAQRFHYQLAFLQHWDTRSWGLDWKRNLRYLSKDNKNSSASISHLHRRPSKSTKMLPFQSKVRLQYWIVNLPSLTR